MSVGPGSPPTRSAGISKEAHRRGLAADLRRDIYSGWARHTGLFM